MLIKEMKKSHIHRVFVTKPPPWHQGQYLQFLGLRLEEPTDTLNANLGTVLGTFGECLGQDRTLPSSDIPSSSCPSQLWLP